MFCGSEHIPTERTQDAEKNSKLGILWKHIYLYANIDFLL